jgi:hypothetical protein
LEHRPLRPVRDYVTMVCWKYDVERHHSVCHEGTWVRLPSSQIGALGAQAYAELVAMKYNIDQRVSSVRLML